MIITGVLIMEKISYHNLFAIITGLFMLIIGCLIAYLSQKYLFSKYRGKAKNAMDKEYPEVQTKCK